MSKNGTAELNGKATANGSTNGKGQILVVRPSHGKTETTKKEEPETTKPEETPTAEVQPPTIKPLPTLEEQRTRAEVLLSLIDREGKLSDTRSRLNKFKLASDESTNVLTIKDGKGTDFVINNPQTIGEVLELMKARIEKRLQEVQMQIIQA